MTIVKGWIALYDADGKIQICPELYGSEEEARAASRTVVGGTYILKNVYEPILISRGVNETAIPCRYCGHL